jgi:hypothetical protein
VLSIGIPKTNPVKETKKANDSLLDGVTLGHSSDIPLQTRHLTVWH